MEPSRVLHQLLDGDRLLGIEAIPRARFPVVAGADTTPSLRVMTPPIGAPVVRPSSPPMRVPHMPQNEVGSWQSALEIPLGSAQPAILSILFVSIEWGAPLSGEARALFDRQVAAMKVAPSSAGLVRLIWSAATEPSSQALENAQAQVFAVLEKNKPQVMVLFGGFSAKALVGAASLTMARGKWFECKGIQTCATWHPAQLGIDKDRRAQTWEDLQKVMAKLGN